MHCSIYKGRRTPDTYLFVPVKDDFTAVPAALLQTMGPLEHVMDLVLTPQRQLARAESVTIMRRLLLQGCYVQMPPRDDEHGPDMSL